LPFLYTLCFSRVWSLKVLMLVKDTLQIEQKQLPAPLCNDRTCLLAFCMFVKDLSHSMQTIRDPSSSRKDSTKPVRRVHQSVHQFTLTGGLLWIMPVHFSHVITKCPVVFQFFSTVFTCNSFHWRCVLEPYMSLSIMFVSQDFVTNETHRPALSLCHHSLQITWDKGIHCGGPATFLVLWNLVMWIFKAFLDPVSWPQTWQE